jgi:hypothetical protein
MRLLTLNFRRLLSSSDPAGIVFAYVTNLKTNELKRFKSHRVPKIVPIFTLHQFETA